MSVNKEKLLHSKMFWVGILYFAEGFPLGIFYDVFPVHFRQQGVNLSDIGFLSLLGLAWTLKFLWAPAIDHYRHHRRWIFISNLFMGGVMLLFSIYADFGPWAWFAIGIFTMLSATNDVAIDGYTIEMLSKKEMGLANGLRIGFYRVGMLAAGFILILSDWLGWSATYLSAVFIFAIIGLFILLLAPSEKTYERKSSISLWSEFNQIATNPKATTAIVLFFLACIWLINRVTQWSESHEYFWYYLQVPGLLIIFASIALKNRKDSLNPSVSLADEELSKGPMFGALLNMLQRPYIIPVIIFILIFKLGDSAMGFMIKPFWVDAGFTASEIGWVSVNLGLILSIAGGVAGGWITDRIGIFRALWILGLFQALSNLGYAFVASQFESIEASGLSSSFRMMMYSASGLESFTGGLGTAAFLAFLMAIVDKRHSATEYALLSSVFALSRSVSGWAGGYGAEIMGYADYFFLTVFLALPAYLLLPWVSKMMKYAASRPDWDQH